MLGGLSLTMPSYLGDACVFQCYYFPLVQRVTSHMHSFTRIQCTRSCAWTAWLTWNIHFLLRDATVYLMDMLKCMPLVPDPRLCDLIDSQACIHGNLRGLQTRILPLYLSRHAPLYRKRLHLCFFLYILWDQTPFLSIRTWSIYVGTLIALLWERIVWLPRWVPPLPTI